MTDFYIDFNESVTNPTPGGVWRNVVNAAPLAVGTVIADILDSTGASTGWELYCSTIFNSDVYSTSYADNANDWPIEVLRGHWRTGNGVTSVLELRNLTSGDTANIKVCGNGDNLTRNTDFIVEGVTKPYVMGTRAAVTNPTSFDLTVPVSNSISIGTKLAATGGSFYGFINGIQGSITPAAPSTSITPTDATPNDGDVQTITCAGMTGPITAATIAGKDILADLSGTDPSVPITFTTDVAALAASATDGNFPRIGQTSTISFTTATDGAVTTDVTIQPKTGWAVVDLAATLVKGVDDLLALIDAKHSITTAIGNQLYYSQAYGESITAQGVYTGGTLLPYQFTEYVIQQGGGSTTVAASYGERFYPFGESGGNSPSLKSAPLSISIGIGL